MIYIKFIFLPFMALICGSQKEKKAGNPDKERTSSEISRINKNEVHLANAFKDHLDQEVRSSDSQMLKSYLIIKEYLTERKEVETKQVLCVDLGGTSLKIGIVEISSENIKILTHKNGKSIRKNYLIPHKNKNITENFTIYQWMAEKIDDFISENRKKKKNVPTLGALTFSFPLKLQNDEICIVGYTKDIKWKKPHIPGECEVPIKELNKVLKERKISVEFKVIVNDAMATLFSAKCESPNAVLGLVLGTGTNGAYFEDMQGILLPENREKKYIENTKGNEVLLCALNTEWGNFNADVVQKYRDNIDIELDKHTNSSGNYLIEKMIGGLYFQQYVNIWFKKEAKKLLLEYMQNKEHTKEDKKVFFSIKTEMSKKIKEFYIKNEDLENTKIDKIVEEFFVQSNSSADKVLVDNMKEKLKEILEIASARRVSVLSALIVSILKKKIQNWNEKSTVYVGLNGSICTLPGFISEVTEKIYSILKKMHINAGPEHGVEIKLFYKEDASLIGAAYVFEYGVYPI